MGLCYLISMSPALPIAYAENIGGDFDSDLNQIVFEYSYKYPQHKEKIESKVEAYRCQNSYREYYEKNSNGAIENICDSLDCYINYCVSNDDCYETQPAVETFSPLAVDGNSWRVLYYVNTPLVQQQKDHYCAPASVYMTIEGIKNHIPSNVRSNITNSQYENAIAMHTDPAKGTSEGAVRDRLTAMLNGKRYVMDYKYLDEGGINFSQDEFITYIKNSLAANGPVIILIYNPFLSYYPSNYPHKNSGHYIVVSECVESQSGNAVTFTIKDPNNWNAGELCSSHVVSASDLYSCFVAMVWMK